MSQIIASTYEIIKRLGAGGGGNVYLAQHLRLKKKVVLKIDKRKLSASKEFLRREVDILKELSHPYIPRVYDFFVEGEEVCTVMDYIEGESLDKALKRGVRFSQAQVIGWACQLLDALCYLHSPVHGHPPKGFVHSDIKPANLMLAPKGNICLIDFNIALALGEEGVIGCSAGYASPEHYGFDFSSKYEEEDDRRTDERIMNAGSTDDTDLTMTVVSENDALTVTVAGDNADPVNIRWTSRDKGSFSMSGSVSSSRKRMVTPDVRSDIYGVGATLYHLLSGKRPSRNAKEVVRLSDDLFNPQLVKIITKAMDPNPDLRYQNAREMLQDFQNLRVNDPRMRRWRKHRRIAAAMFPVMFLAGGLAAFAGLKGMQMTESWLKLTEYAQSALDKGDVEEAIDHSTKVLSESSGRFVPEHIPGVQKVLTEAVGAYDLSDGYKIYKTIELPSAPHYIAIAPDGKSAAALCGEKVVVFDTVSAKTAAELPSGESSISQIRYLDEHTILYDGQDGMTAYDIREGRELWTGGAASSICVSGDGKTAVGICEGDTFAAVYDTKTGAVRYKVDFAGKSQNIGIKDNLFALNEDGSLLGVSFRDGSLKIYTLGYSGTDDFEGEDDQGYCNELTVYGADSGYTRFEGGFCGQYLAFAASGEEKEVFAVIDAAKGEECGGFQGETDFGVQADENGIYVQSDHILVKVDPVTGEQAPLVTMDENILRFVRDEAYTLATSEDGIYFFDKDARMTSHYRKEYLSDLIGIAGGTAVIGSMDRPAVRIMKYEENSETEIFTYDPGYQHDEARISADRQTVMLFSYRQFRIYDKAGKLVKEADIPEADRVIDQQFIRDGKESWLEVIYDNGKEDVYSASDGSLLREGYDKKRNISNGLDEEFVIGDLRIESPLHGTPAVYDAKTGREVARLKKDTYLTDVTQAGDYLAARYKEAGGIGFGQLMDNNCEVLAELPYLCDVGKETLIFDYPAGSIRESKIYELEEIVEMSEAY
ncbi:MAG: protein kinase [Dorea sp.]|nr:protein kinase [Dorea sp.]